MEYIQPAFNSLGIVVDRAKIRAVQSMVLHFRLRDTNLLTLNGMLLACDPIAFKTQDRSALFHIFGIEERDVANLIKKIPTIDRSHNVESDPFNLLCFWLIHLGYVYLDDARIRHDFQMAICQYYHYKLFTSIVNNSFRHGANRGIMQATINSLTKKSDIVRYESWGALIDAHCEKFLEDTGENGRGLEKASPDELVKRWITGTQTALRNKIVLIAKTYYEAHKNGDTIGYSSSVSEDAEGEKIIAQTASVVDSVMLEMVRDVTVLNMWLDDTDIALVANNYSALTPKMLKTFLSLFSEEAVHQMSSRTFDLVKSKKGSPDVLYVGIRAFLFEIVRSSLRFCRLKKLNPAQKATCTTALRDVYASSRNTDVDILNIKNSMAHLISTFRVEYNETAMSAMKLAMIQYIILRVFRKL